MTVDEIAKLKAELHALNCRIQAERNDEVRHALQRGRLEAERAQALVKLMDAQVASIQPPDRPIIPPSSADPAAGFVVLRSPASDRPGNGVALQSKPAAAVVLGGLSAKHKPAGMPTLKTMVATAFEGHTELKTDQIFAFVRRRWWPSAPRNRVRSTIWKMCATGQLEKGAGVYRLNGHG